MGDGWNICPLERGADPLLLSFSRSFLTVPALLFFLYWKREALPPIRTGDLLPVIISGVLRAAGLYFYFVAIGFSRCGGSLMENQNKKATGKEIMG